MPEDETFSQMLERDEQEKENRERLPHVTLLLDKIIDNIDEDREVDDL